MSWILYIDLGLITSEQSQDNPSKALSDELTTTYITNEKDEVEEHYARVGKGSFLVFDEGEPSPRAPEDMWSRATPKHQRTLA